MLNSKSLKIAYIGGGSMGWARMFMVDLALEPELGGEIRLYDIDGEAAARNEIIGNRITANERSVGKWRYLTATTLQEALTGADFVITSILPGTFEHMRSDVHLPERHGIYQPVGDSVGPGGILRALRTVPQYVIFAEAIRDFAPDAWVINYTNPMSMCMRTLYRVFPQIKAFGCCHEVFGAQDMLASMLRDEMGEKPPRDEIKVNVIGINHFTWFNSATYQGKDLMPMFKRFADGYYEKGFPNDGYNEQDESFRCTNRVKLDLYKKYGLIAAAGDRHLVEFMPGDIYLKDLDTINNWGFALTSVDWRIADRMRKVEHTKRLASGEEELALNSSGEEGIMLIKALCGLMSVVTNVNLPNTKLQIANFPTETVVETNAEFSHDNIRPVDAGRMPDDIYALCLAHIENQTQVLDAALSNDVNAVYSAFAREPLVQGRCSEDEIRELVDDMIENTLGDFSLR
ncbi:MAG: alpha-glucosidase/alpha-galactosidase [Oscillospiraceae bacterium]|jgi:alpha-galactosidase|nr:alpha-glucosidase/alpha-galactosidase [Oscillospiraceae bacterium]